ncbi:MAG: hypothetical protein IKV39_04550 [Clostridia bacterium]|nr:hypothetical protein [Clostridia bacterium]
MTPLPCLIFSADGYLCDEQGALSAMRENHGINGLRATFDSALGNETLSFKEFCKTKSNEKSGKYRIYRVFGIEGYLYAFCEKNVFLDDEYTFVYLARDISEFYRFMSPSSSYYSDTVGKIIYELLYLREKQRYEPTSITPEAFLTLSRIPYLTEAIFENRQSAQNCDICIAAEHTLSHLRSSPLFRDATLRFSVNDPVFIAYSANSLLGIPLEAFVAVLLLSVAIASALSQDRTINVSLTQLCSSATVRITTHSDKFDQDVKCLGIQELCLFSHPVDSFSRITSVIAMVSEFGISYSYNKATGELALDIVIGGEIPPDADFKYRDPTDTINNLTDDIQNLYDLIN